MRTESGSIAEVSHLAYIYRSAKYDISNKNYIIFQLCRRTTILFKHHDDSPCQNVIVGVPCGPSSFNLGNVKCVAVGECSRNVYNHLVYYKIGNESTLHSIVNLRFYLLEHVGGFLLDIANSRERFGHLKKL